MKQILLTTQEIEILNEAGEKELTASNTYRYLASCMQKYGFFGAQKYFLKESEDEIKHYQMLVDYANDRGVELEMPELPEIDTEAGDLIGALHMAYGMEIELENKYVGWYGKVGVVTQVFLQKMLKIQRKSIGEYGDLIARYGIALDKAQFDKELGEK